MAALQSGGRLLAPIEQETALAWAGFVLLTLDAIGVQQHAEVCSQLQPPMPAILCHALYQLAGKTVHSAPAPSCSTRPRRRARTPPLNGAGLCGSPRPPQLLPPAGSRCLPQACRPALCAPPSAPLRWPCCASTR